MQKHQFQTQVSDLLNLMIHSLYSNKEIFLRELISNASDALDKLNYLSLTNDEYKSLQYSPRIDIKLDKEAKTLVISDNGIGMDENYLQNKAYFLTLMEYYIFQFLQFFSQMVMELFFF